MNEDTKQGIVLAIFALLFCCIFWQCSVDLFVKDHTTHCAEAKVAK